MGRLLETFLGEVRYAARDLLRNRSFTAAARFAVALGIGASTAIFSVVDRVLFRSLPYPEADRLVSVGMFAPILPQEFLLGYDYVDWRAAAMSPFESMGAMSSGLHDCDLNDSRPVRLRCGRIDADLLRTLGTGIAAGREFTRADERLNAPPIALVSFSLWRSRLGGDAAAIGRTIPVDGNPITIVGGSKPISASDITGGSGGNLPPCWALPHTSLRSAGGPLHAARHIMTALDAR